jgi:hypothetical protein
MRSILQRGVFCRATNHGWRLGPKAAWLIALALLGGSLLALTWTASGSASASHSGAFKETRGLILAQAENPPAGSAQPNRVTNQPPEVKQAPAAGAGAGDDSPKAYVTFKTPYEFFLCVITVVLGVGTLLLLVVMYWRSGPSEEFIRAFIVTSVIFAALFLIVAGYNEKQTAPVFGLLGTILGYVFGKVAASTPARTGTPTPTPAQNVTPN